MGGAAKKIGRGVSGVFTLGGSEIARNNLKKSNIVNKVLQTPGVIVTGGASKGWGGGDTASQDPSAPFSLSPDEVAANRGAITQLGDEQYNQTQAFNTSDQLARETQRSKLAELLTNQAKNSFARTLPDIAENSQAAHLYDSTGYGQEVARQQAALGQDIASQIGQVGLQDINRSSDIGYGALQAKNGMGQSALSRQFSLEDFIRQANVAKAIGAQSAPQVGNGKGGIFTSGATGAAAGAPFGPWGAAIGGLGGALLGSQGTKGK